jgi:hypothetical protein
MTQYPATHDVLLSCGDGSKRKFQVYGRPMPRHGEVITLPVDGQLIRARVTVSSDQPEMNRSVDAQLLELV